jgi:hypothetical protein
MNEEGRKALMFFLPSSFINNILKLINFKNRDYFSI